MADDSRTSRRTALRLGAGLLTIPLAGCNDIGLGRSRGPSVTPVDETDSDGDAGEQSDPWDTKVQFELPEHVEAWSSYRVDVEATSEFDFTRAVVAFRNDSSIDDETYQQEVESGDAWTPEIWGEYEYEIRLEGSDDSHTVHTRSVSVSPATPDAFEPEQFSDLLDQWRKEVNADVILSWISEQNEYTSNANQLFAALHYLFEETDVPAAAVASSIYGTSWEADGIPDEKMPFITAIPESPDEYAQSFANVEGYGRAFVMNVSDIQPFENELYGFDRALKHGLRVDQSPVETEQDLELMLFRARSGLLKKGHFTTTDIDYLRTLSEIIQYQRVPADPRWEVAQPLVERHTADAELTQQELEELTAVQQYEPADQYGDRVKQRVIGIDPNRDVILLETEYTKAVDMEATRATLQTALTRFHDETGIVVVAPQAETRPDPFESDPELDSRMNERMRELARRGMHLISFDYDHPDESVIARTTSTNDSNYVVIGPEQDAHTTLILHELGHVFGIQGNDVPWNDERDVEDGAEESMMSYAGSDNLRFVGEDISEMRRSNYDQADMSMRTLDSWANEGKMLTDVYSQVLTPDGVELDTATDR